MNAFNTINLAGAIVLTSTAAAKELGIDERKWIYALGGAGTSDSGNCECSPGCLRYLDILKSGKGPTTTLAHPSRDR